MKKYIWIMFMCAAPAFADDATPLLYSRSSIAIHHVGAPLEPALPWQKHPPEQNNLNFEVEVRDGVTLYNQKGWFNLSAPDENSGVLFVFAALTVAPIIPSDNYTPLDILFINQEGTIEQIAPNLALNDLKDEVYPQNPVLALLFLKGGTCAAKSITPGDEVEYPIFKKPPVMLVTPPAKK